MFTCAKSKFTMNRYFFKKSILTIYFLSVAVFFSLVLNAQTSLITDDATLLDSFIQSRKYGSIIVFSSSNIKQFWIEKNILSQNGLIKVILNKDFKSNPLKIQLANVNETQDCKIDVISNTTDLSFLFFYDKSKVLSQSSSEDNFINYNISSASIHLEDTQNKTFFLQFFSSNSDELNIQRIILSFSKNISSNYVASSGTLNISDLFSYGNGQTVLKNDNSVKISTTNNGSIISKRILVSDGQTLSNHLVLKNTGLHNAKVWFGYSQYTKDGKKIDNMNNIYKDNKILRIVSAKKGSKTLVVDSEPEWTAGCRLVLNPKEDISDFPNFSFVDGVIQDVKKIDDTHYEISFSKVNSQDIKTGTQVRVQCGAGPASLYAHYKILLPGEEASFSRSIKVDFNCLQYYNNDKDICRGTYYVIPFLNILIDSSENDNNEEISVEVLDFNIDF